MESITDKIQEVLSCNKLNTKKMYVGDTILASASETGIDENWGLFDNQSTCNTFINDKYLSNIRYAHDGQYIPVHGN